LVGFPQDNSGVFVGGDACVTAGFVFLLALQRSLFMTHVPGKGMPSMENYADS
jgi:hypothetical protein